MGRVGRCGGGSGGRSHSTGGSGKGAYGGSRPILNPGMKSYGEQPIKLGTTSSPSSSSSSSSPLTSHNSSALLPTGSVSIKQNGISPTNHGFFNNIMDGFRSGYTKLLGKGTQHVPLSSVPLSSVPLSSVPLSSPTMSSPTIASSSSPTIASSSSPSSLATTPHPPQPSTTKISSPDPVKPHEKTNDKPHDDHSIRPTGTGVHYSKSETNPCQADIISLKTCLVRFNYHIATCKHYIDALDKCQQTFTTPSI